jgi:hypothetical protein
MRRPLIHAAIAAAALGGLASCRADSVTSSSKDVGISANQVTGGSSVSYQYLVGVDGLASPDVAVAASGDRIEATGQGTFTLHSKSITGSGSFTLKAPDGTVLGSGTWSATQLLSFNSYGAPPGFPAFQGGLAVIEVHLSTGLDAVLEVSCLVGSPPPAAHEGISLAVEGGPNFNKQVSGETLFIQQ